ncbi:enolase [Anopheles sinensis]|uniref:Enolase n=1 Tax=Anopheles sinensis TaxID=74873 RepID=A0A084VYD0_ANOSI|nr:enolase [Anopheles sinensis]
MHPVPLSEVCIVTIKGTIQQLLAREKAHKPAEDAGYVIDRSNCAIGPSVANSDRFPEDAVTIRGSKRNRAQLLAPYTPVALCEAFKISSVGW